MRHELITSVQNPLVKRLHQLLDRKGREEQNRFLVEGAHLVEEALNSGAGVVTVLYDEQREIDPACLRAIEKRQTEIEVVAVSAAVLAKLTETKNPQGIVAEVKKNTRDWQEWMESAANRDYMLLLLDEIQDPGNLGTILRTAEAAGVDGVVLGAGSVDLYNGKVIRSTMGALFRLAVFVRPLPEAIQKVRQQGGRILVSSLKENSLAYHEAAYGGKVALVIGNEGRGVSTQVADLADSYVHIPLYGRAESLNAAVAAGILVYEAQRHRTFPPAN
ncbi:23S rRNA (guanosine(2251)-2'-O)-methyltransferase RlmB [Brevibacillus ruminantium]|uniref:23S rRNA (Guanosine(2251)-2'-O)-methyltransferase RlmB n=1 Tax=Brevibacillus ruminantium TaxID=2950604 RepID=A0ABY4WB53_9BACL|nr:23S rRNA (guanosine(2251)-2'-O)-methyltransferase RlmB [Brevibacillus ruminantium]USG64278.1 23S rRNA (guanosine(2251)-2'-O)-methyltransferase RlmB [Brevibacillus ruminantium]